MESVLLSGTASKAYSLEPGIINDIIEQWSSVPIEPERLSPQEKYFCYLKGKLFQAASVQMRFKVLCTVGALFADVCLFFDDY
jgi:hypothetical protein